MMDRRRSKTEGEWNGGGGFGIGYSGEKVAFLLKIFVRLLNACTCSFITIRVNLKVSDVKEMVQVCLHSVGRRFRD